VPSLMKITFRVSWSRFAERVVRLLLGIVAKVPPVSVRWERLSGPFFGNELAEFDARGRQAETVLRKSSGRGDDARLVEVDRQVLAS
jgi:hypothetical protein